MSHAELCPVCFGKGTICDHPKGMPASLHPTCPTCHACGGSGWVTVQDSPYPIWQSICKHPIEKEE